MRGVTAGISAPDPQERQKVHRSAQGCYRASCRMDAFDSGAEHSDEEAAAYFARKKRTENAPDRKRKDTDKSSKRTDNSSKRTDKTRKRLAHLVQPKATKAKHAAARPGEPSARVSKQQVQLTCDGVQPPANCTLCNDCVCCRQMWARRFRIGNWIW